MLVGRAAHKVLKRGCTGHLPGAVKLLQMTDAFTRPSISLPCSDRDSTELFSTDFERRM
jgi:hypothetical protein